MPIEIPTETSAPIFTPKTNYEIARYFNLSKFLSLIQTSNLFFSRLDKFEDKYEGTYPELSYTEMKIWYEQFFNKKIKPLREVNIPDEVENSLDLERKDAEIFKSITCVSCWNKHKSESYALWKIYSDLNQGIMIKSNIQNLINSFKEAKEKILLSEVNYIDYKNESIKWGNSYFPIIHKNISYNYEDEIRLIHVVNEKFKEFDWSKEPISVGKYIKVD